MTEVITDWQTFAATVIEAAARRQGEAAARLELTDSNGRRLLPVEFVGGSWRVGGTEQDPDALVTYATEPSPETGHVGWVWWARGSIGEAPTLMEAMWKAEARLGRLDP